MKKNFAHEIDLRSLSTLWVIKEKKEFYADKWIEVFSFPLKHRIPPAVFFSGRYPRILT